MKYGFIKTAAAEPDILVAAPRHNAKEIARLIGKAYGEGAGILAFPDLCLTGSACGDLFRTDALISRTEAALSDIAAATAGKKMLVLVGTPLCVNGRLYRAAAAFSDGEMIGFTVADNREAGDGTGIFTDAGDEPLLADIAGIGTVAGARDVIFSCREMPSLKAAVLFGSDSADYAASLGATVLIRMSSEAETVGREKTVRTAAEADSARTDATLVYVSAGRGESTTDHVQSGHMLISACGTVLREKAPFGEEDLLTAVTDTQRSLALRMRRPAVSDLSECVFDFSFSLEERETDIAGWIDPEPFLPKDEDAAAVCGRILEIQAHGLAKRIRAASSAGCVVALSGGLDSTLALIVTVRAAELTGMDMKKITSVTMPCFGTTGRTRTNAEKLALGFGTSFRCIDIKAAVDQHFADIGHKADDYSVVYENAQARERTQIVMDIANAENALVIGTGDLSELALGWATYNGDQMSNYGVNAGVPKTVIRRVVAFCADRYEAEGRAELAETLRDILATPVSPELLPASGGEIAQKTEELVGPYELHDFFLWHYLRWGESPEKIEHEALAAFAGLYDRETVHRWLDTFFRRFASQQFKRSALPDGPQVFDISLSPRGGWQMPSDTCGWELRFQND